MSSGANELRDIEQTLMKHIAMELRDEDPHQFVNAYTAGKDVKVCVTSKPDTPVCKISYKYFYIWKSIIYLPKLQRTVFAILSESMLIILLFCPKSVNISVKFIRSKVIICNGLIYLTYSVLRTAAFWESIWFMWLLNAPLRSFAWKVLL